MTSQQMRRNTTETVIPSPTYSFFFSFFFNNRYLNNINVITCCSVGSGTKLHLTMLQLVLLQKKKKRKFIGIWSEVNEECT